MLYKTQLYFPSDRNIWVFFAQLNYSNYSSIENNLQLVVNSDWQAISLQRNYTGCVYILYPIVKSSSKTYRTLRASDLWSHIMKNTNIHMHTLEDTQICYSLKRDCRNRLLFFKLPRCFSSRNPPSSQPPFFCQCLIGWLGPISEALSLRASTL